MNTPLALAALAGLSVALIVIGLNSLLANTVDVSARLGYWSAPGRQAGRSKPSANRKSPISKQIDRALANSDFASTIQRELARANLKLTVSEYLTINALSTVVVAILSFSISRHPAAALVGAALGLYLPRLYVKRRQAARTKAFNDQLADNIMLIANALRSGYSLLQSLELVSREAPEPSAEEFGRVVKEVGFGLTPEEALHHLVERMESDDLDLMVTAINVQHEVGGNLAHILDSIGTTIRERVRIKGEIKSLTAQQTLSGYIISLLPVGIGFILFLLNSRYIVQLFSFERVAGIPVIALPLCAGTLLIVGFIAMRRITNIEV